MSNTRTIEITAKTEEEARKEIKELVEKVVVHINYLTMMLLLKNLNHHFFK